MKYIIDDKILEKIIKVAFKNGESAEYLMKYYEKDEAFKENELKETIKLIKESLIEKY